MNGTAATTVKVPCGYTLSLILRFRRQWFPKGRRGRPLTGVDISISIKVRFLDDVVCSRNTYCASYFCLMLCPPWRGDAIAILGSQTECLYKLLQCGIPAGDLPLNDDGTIDVTRHHQWMRDAVGITTSL